MKGIPNQATTSETSRILVVDDHAAGRYAVSRTLRKVGFEILEAATGEEALAITGRELPDLQKVFERLDLFDLVVAENGALIYNPASRQERALVDAPSEQFVA